MSWPVSTTYSSEFIWTLFLDRERLIWRIAVVAAVAGVGVALGGPESVNWGWNNGKGLATIFSGLIIGTVNFFSGQSCY
jgi:sodium-dependent phosphate transporter